MPDVDIKQIKKLREETGLGMLDCKEALEETQGDFKKAITVLEKRGKVIAERRGGRKTGQGRVEAYVHGGGKIGVLVELRSETDFVAKSKEFIKLAHEIAMQVTAMGPKYLSRDDIPGEMLEEKKKIYQEQFKNENKPPEIIDKIVNGKLEEFYSQVCLLDQPYIRDDKKKIKDLIDEARARFGENICIERFVRFEI